MMVVCSLARADSFAKSSSNKVYDAVVHATDQQQEDWLMMVRTQHCDGYQAVLDEVKYRFDRRTEQQMRAAEWDLASVLVMAALDQAVQIGTMSKFCLVRIEDGQMDETSTFILLTPEGDVAIGYEMAQSDWREGTAYTRWSDVRPKGFRYDVLYVRDYTGGYPAGYWEDEVVMPMQPRGTRCVGDPDMDDIWPECIP
jgi:hypothetical protein